MKELRIFCAIFLFPLLASGAGKQVITGHNRQVGAVACVVPTVSHRWAVYDAGTTCTSGCTNGHAITGIIDIGTLANQAMSTASGTNTYNASVVNSLPASQFDGSSWYASGSWLNTGTTNTYYAVYSNLTNGSSTTTLIGSSFSGGAEILIGTGSAPRRDAVAVHNQGISAIVAGSTAYNYSSGFVTIVAQQIAGAWTTYRCQSGTCSALDTGTGGPIQPDSLIGKGSSFASANMQFAEIGVDVGAATSLSVIGAWSQCKYGI